MIRTRGPYNFDEPKGTSYSADTYTTNGFIKAPTSRWAGIMKGLYNTDFEAANIETVNSGCWILFVSKADGSPATKGYLNINLGDISGDVMKRWSNSILKMDCLLLKMLPCREYPGVEYHF